MSIGALRAADIAGGSLILEPLMGTLKGRSFLS
jgi:hypothetical protein